MRIGFDCHAWIYYVCWLVYLNQRKGLLQANCKIIYYKILRRFAG